MHFKGLMYIWGSPTSDPAWTWWHGRQTSADVSPKSGQVIIYRTPHVGFPCLYMTSKVRIDIDSVYTSFKYLTVDECSMLVVVSHFVLFSILYNV